VYSNEPYFSVVSSEVAPFTFKFCGWSHESKTSYVQLRTKVTHINIFNKPSLMQYSKSEERLSLLEEMEAEFDKKNVDYFRKLLKHEDYVIRTRAVCILADIAGEDAVDPIGDVLLNDPDGLVRHEAAFSLGQMGFRRAIQVLGKAVESDENPFVRHEAAVALGVIGSQEARNILERALDDKSEEVRESAIIALSNLDYVVQMKDSNSKFAKMTGG